MVKSKGGNGMSKEKASKWEGLWSQERTGWYKSQTFTIQSLFELFGKQDKFCLILRQNKYWKNNSENKPRFIFSLMDKSFANCKTHELKSTNGEIYEALSNYLEHDDDYYAKLIQDSFSDDDICRIADLLGLCTWGKAEAIMWQANSDGYRGYTDIMIEDYW